MAHVELSSQQFYLDPRKTRSQKTFSPWESYPVKPTFNFESKLKIRFEKSWGEERRWQQSKESDGVSDISNHPSPLSTPPSSPSTSPMIIQASLPSPPTSMPVELCQEQIRSPPKDAAKSDTQRRKERRKASRTLSRNRKREKAAVSFTVQRIREKIVEKYIKSMDVHDCRLDLVKEGRVADKGYVGQKSENPYPKEEFCLGDLVGPASEGFELLNWDGVKPMALVDSRQRVIGILAGNPGEDDWDCVEREATEAVEAARLQSLFPKEKDRKGKRSRGDFDVLACGVSYGGGQNKPCDVYNGRRNQSVLDRLCSLRCFKRISGFSTSVVATRAPKLHHYYAETMIALYKQHPYLTRPFPGSIFAGTTYNMGPRTICTAHCDPGNLPNGVCSITPFGRYNPDTGGHLILWDLELVIRFPPGSTILIPSAVLTHSNAAVGPTECRYSFTQYTAGGIFRWVENGFMTENARRESMSRKELKKELERDAGRWKAGVEMLPIWEKDAAS